MSNSQESIAILNKQFEDILAPSNGTDEAAKFVKNYIQRSWIWRCVQILIFVALFTIVAGLLVYYVPILNWNASAVGRLALIKLILPAYNWQHLYNSRCLMEISTGEHVEKQQENIDEFRDDYCTVCENLGNIQRIKSISRPPNNV